MFQQEPRTVFIVFYYSCICLAFYGPPSIMGTLCSVYVFGVLLMSLFIFALFNLEISKDWAIQTVGKEYYENYVSHSLGDRLF